MTSIYACVAERRTRGTDAAVRDLDLDVLRAKRAGMVLEGLERYALKHRVEQGVPRTKLCGEVMGCTFVCAA